MAKPLRLRRSVTCDPEARLPNFECSAMLQIEYQFSLATYPISFGHFSASVFESVIAAHVYAFRAADECEHSAADDGDRASAYRI
jgi:hypothetical protein